MYIPAPFVETRTEVLHAFIRAHPLGILVTEGLEATHLPLFLDASAGVLRCHMARANPQWRRLEGGGRVLVIFSGDQHYITPNWYPSRHEHGKVVPTWNYVAVHAAGTARLIEDPAALLRHLHELTDAQEKVFAKPWSAADAPPAFVGNLMKAIVGIEISLDQLEGKWKVSQNRSEADQLGVADGLETLGSPASVAMANLVRKARSSR